MIPVQDLCGRACDFASSLSVISRIECNFAIIAEEIVSLGTIIERYLRNRSVVARTGTKFGLSDAKRRKTPSRTY
jgi:hypothetical protein